MTKRISNSSGLPASQESHTGEREHFSGHSHWSALSQVGVPGPITEADVGSFISDWSDLVLCLLLVGDGWGDGIMGPETWKGIIPPLANQRCGLVWRCSLWLYINCFVVVAMVVSFDQKKKKRDSKQAKPT